MGGRRPLTAVLAFWLAWTLAFSVARAVVEAVLRTRLPHLGYLLGAFVVALVLLALGIRLWDGWRGALGAISVLFPLATLAAVLVRHLRDPSRNPLPGTSALALGVAVLGSMVVGVVLFHAEQLRRRVRGGDLGERAV